MSSDIGARRARPELRRRHPCFVVAPQTPRSWYVDNEPLPDLSEAALAKYPKPWPQYLRGYLLRNNIKHEAAVSTIAS